MKQKGTKKSSEVKILPLGGLGAIGKNITLFEQNGEIIIVDCGIMFPGEDLPGVDFIIPDLSYIRKNKDKVKGILLTHGHEDHIGAVSFLLQEVKAPLYGTKLTLGLVQSRLEERSPGYEPEFKEIEPREVAEIGTFSVEFIRVNHSIIGGVGLAIETVAGTIIHTGDFKIDFSPLDGEVTDIYRLAHHGERGVLLLMSDSTNSEKEGFTKSESILTDRLIEIFSCAKGRVIVASFASNIQRLQQVFDIAVKYNRRVVISGFTMQKNIEIAKNLGFLEIKEDLIVSIDEAGRLPDKKLVIIGTGTQGEPMSALSRMALGTHRHFIAKKGDTVVITASVIPGNERMVNNIVNALMESGVNVFYEKVRDIHVSGHASSKELKLMITITKPKFFMPVHGEFKHLKKHAELASQLNIKDSKIMIAKNGDILTLSKNSFKKTGEIDLADIYVDGKEQGDVTDSLIKERQEMSEYGIVIITTVFSQGMLLSLPSIETRGFQENPKINGILRKDIESRLNKLAGDGLNPNEMELHLKRGLSNFLFKLTRKKPLIIVKVMEV